MKKLFVLFVVFFVNDAKSVCYYNDAYAQASQNVEKNTRHKVTKNYEIASYEHKIRNLCIDNLYYIDLNYYINECRKENQEEMVNFYIDPDFPIENIYNYLTLDECLKEDITNLESKLRTLGSEETIRRLYDLDKIIMQIENPYEINGNAKISINPGICYSRNFNGDTIWHAWARREYIEKFTSVSSCDNYDECECYGEDYYEYECRAKTNNGTEWVLFIDSCLQHTTKNDNMFSALLEAVFLTKNNNGKTPIAEAIERGNLQRFSNIRQYFEQNNIEYKKLLKAAAKEANISYEKLSKAWNSGTEIKIKKEITVNSSGVQTKNKYK